MAIIFAGFVTMNIKNNFLLVRQDDLKDVTFIILG